MLLIYKTLLTSLLLLQILCRNIIFAKPTILKYSNETLKLAKGIQMAAYMNVDANPCDDFYNWACGHWSLSHPASEAQHKTSLVGLLEDLYVQKCADALQQSIGNETSIGTAAADVYLDNLLKTVFDSCYITNAIKVVGFTPIWDALEFHNGWPLVADNDWFDNKYDWLKLVVLAKRKFNADVFIGFNVVKDLQHPETYRIQLSAPQLGLNESQIYLSEEHAEARESYQSYIENKLKLFFPEMPNAWSEEIASQVLQVEEKLAKALSNRTNDATPLERYVAELKVSYGNYVDLSRYLQLMFDRPINEKIYEMPKGYFKNLVDIIRLTPKLTLANYTLWKVLDQFDLGGSKEFCVRKLMHFFPHEMEYFFYRNYEDTNLVRQLQISFNHLKYSFSDEMQTSKRFNWILPQTLKNLIEKLRSMRVEVMQPQELVGLFQGGIKPINMQADQYYSNIINILEWKNEKELLKLHQAATLLNNPPTNQPSYERNLLPIYNSQMNIIQVPVIFLQSRFFWDPTYPSAIKYGTFTFLLAQQIVRGLSEDETESDQHKIWDIASELRFTKRSSCYAQQSFYSAKEFHSRNVTDRERLKKALMDNGGLSIAYRIYEQQTHDKQVHRLSVLPMLPITNMQQFFLAYAQLFCADYAEVVTEYGDLPEALRVNGAVANLEEFSKEFKCSDTSNLNPKEKCGIF